jgi:hypothetical protein
MCIVTDKLCYASLMALFLMLKCVKCCRALNVYFKASYEENYTKQSCKGVKCLNTT